MEDRELLTFFENLIMKFYNNDSEFKRFFDDGAQEILGWHPMYVGDYVCTIETGSERACLLFDGVGRGYNSIVDNYAVKISLDYLTDGECIQMVREYQNYGRFAQIHCQELVAKVIKGEKLTDLLHFSKDSDAHMYVVERADVSEEEYDDVLYEFIDRNIEEFDTPFYWEWPEDTKQSYDDLEQYEKYEYINMLLEEYDSIDKYRFLLEAFGYHLSYDATFWNLIDEIGDLHHENISVCRGRPIIVDYGFDAIKGGKWA